MTTDAPANPSPSPDGHGLALGIASYGIWGLLPLYFILVDFASAVEIVANRTLWSLLFCLFLLPFRRGFAHVWQTLRQGRLVRRLAVAASLVACNWLIYVYAVTHGHVVQAALGYFINPVLTVLLGVLVLHERMRGLQWLAVGISVVAIVVLTLDYGHLPWLALALAVTFGLYSLAKNHIGRDVGAISSLSVETLLLAPLALGAMLWLDHHGQGHFGRDGTAHSLLLMASGIVTALPLVLFAAAARRLPLSTLGLLQYLAPMMQFLIGVFVLHEAMPPSRWIGFILIWTALSLISFDAIRHTRRNRALRRSALETV